MSDARVPWLAVLFVSAYLLPFLILGSRAILASVQWFNRRDDPRFARRPPDPP